MNLSKTSQLLIILLVCIGTFIINNGALSETLMEARNFTTAREIITNNNWMVPTMNGEIRLAKPPLPTWITAVFGYFFGFNNTSILRLPAALITILMVLSFYGFSRYISKHKYFPFIATLIFSTTMLTAQMARNGSWDIFCHAFMLPAIWQLFVGLKKEDKALNNFLWSGVFMGLSFMSKGPVSFFSMLTPFIISYVIAYGATPFKLKWKYLFTTILITVIISSFWPIYIYFEHHDAVMEMVKTESKSWTNRHVRPFWFYLHFPLFTGVWAFFSITTLIYPFAKKRLNQYGNYKFIFWWAILTICLLSVIPEKKERYMLPVMIPLAILCGYYFCYLLDKIKSNVIQGWDKKLIKLHGFIIGGSLALSPLFFYYILTKDASFSFTANVLNSIFFVGIGLLLIYQTHKLQLNKIIWSNISILTAAIIFISAHIRPLKYKSDNYRSFKEVQANSEIKDMPFYAMYKSNLNRVWEAGKPIQFWDFPNDTTPLNHTPFVLVTGNFPDKLSKTLPSEYELTVIDSFPYDHLNAKVKSYASIIRKVEN